MILFVCLQIENEDIKKLGKDLNKLQAKYEDGFLSETSQWYEPDNAVYECSVGRLLFWKFIGFIMEERALSVLMFWQAGVEMNTVSQRFLRQIKWVFCVGIERATDKHAATAGVYWMSLASSRSQCRPCRVYRTSSVILLVLKISGVITLSSSAKNSFCSLATCSAWSHTSVA